MALTVQMIESKEFSRAAMGYNRKEVDEFLDEICDEMDRLHEEIAGLQMRLSKAGQTQVFKPIPGGVPAPSAAAPAFVPAPIEVVEETEEAEEQEPAPQPAPGRKDPRPVPGREERREEPKKPAEPAPAPAPAPASVTVDAANILAKAQMVYDQTVAEAQKLYDDKVQTAQTEADRIIREAKDSLASQNKRLTEEKAQLEKSIETLKTSASDYRTRLQALLTGQQKVLDDAADLFEA